MTSTSVSKHWFNGGNLKRSISTEVIRFVNLTDFQAIFHGHLMLARNEHKSIDLLYDTLTELHVCLYEIFLPFRPFLLKSTAMYTQNTLNNKKQNWLKP